MFRLHSSGWFIIFSYHDCHVYTETQASSCFWNLVFNLMDVRSTSHINLRLESRMANTQRSTSYKNLSIRRYYSNPLPYHSSPNRSSAQQGENVKLQYKDFRKTTALHNGKFNRVQIGHTVHITRTYPILFMAYLTALSSRMINEWWIGKDLRRKRSWPNLRVS